MRFFNGPPITPRTIDSSFQKMGKPARRACGGRGNRKPRRLHSDTTHHMATVQVDGILTMHFSAPSILMQVSLQARFLRLHLFVHIFALTQVSAEPGGNPMMGKRCNTEDGHAASGDR